MQIISFGVWVKCQANNITWYTVVYIYICVCVCVCVCVYIYIYLRLTKKSLESPLDCKKIQPVHPKDQSWVFTGRTDAEAKTTILWPPHVKS